MIVPRVKKCHDSFVKSSMGARVRCTQVPVSPISDLEPILNLCEVMMAVLRAAYLAMSSLLTFMLWFSRASLLPCAPVWVSCPLTLVLL